MLLGNTYLILSSYYSLRYIFPGFITTPMVQKAAYTEGLVFAVQSFSLFKQVLYLLIGWECSQSCKINSMGIKVGVTIATCTCLWIERLTSKHSFSLLYNKLWLHKQYVEHCEICNKQENISEGMLARCSRVHSRLQWLLSMQMVPIDNDERYEPINDSANDICSLRGDIMLCTTVVTATIKISLSHIQTILALNMGMGKPVVIPKWVSQVWVQLWLLPHCNTPCTHAAVSRYLWVYYSRVILIFFCFEMCFSHFILLFCNCITM